MASSSANLWVLLGLGFAGILIMTRTGSPSWALCSTTNFTTTTDSFSIRRRRLLFLSLLRTPSSTSLVRYHLDEDPKTLKVFPIPLHDSSGTTLHYDHLSISPDGRMLAATHGSTLQWLSAETGQVLDTADRVHDEYTLAR